MHGSRRLRFKLHVRRVGEDQPVAHAVEHNSAPGPVLGEVDLLLLPEERHREKVAAHTVFPVDFVIERQAGELAGRLAGLLFQLIELIDEAVSPGAVPAVRDGHGEDLPAVDGVGDPGGLRGGVHQLAEAVEHDGGLGPGGLSLGVQVQEAAGGGAGEDPGAGGPVQQSSGGADHYPDQG